MAICEYCKQEMKDASGCRERLLQTVDGSFRPIRYGDERKYTLRPPSPGDMQHGMLIADPPRGHDCGVLPGGFHHAIGCDWEECPRCYDQLLSCECLQFDDEPTN